MSDNFAATAKGLESPADRHFAITPSDSTDLDPMPRALFCEAAGTVALRDKTGTTISYTLAQGQILPFRPARVLATGTTATVLGWE